MTWTPIGTIGKRPLKLHTDVRETHMHVLGISGQGKSYFLEHMIREDILAGHGVCIIDPHGELYNNVLRWVTANGFHQSRKIHLLNPSDDEYTFGFNPLCVDNGVDLSTRVEGMVDACVKVWGGTDINQTPRLAKCLLATFYALAKWNLSLAEASIFTNAHMRDVRKRLTAQLANTDFEDVWREFDEALSLKNFAEYFESSNSRLLAFVGNPTIKEIVGQTENLINFRECMDKGHIVLVNLARTGKLSPRSSQLLGALIANDLYNTAFGRDVNYAKRHPFYCYIDECAQYLTEDIVNSLDETRKFGLHLILSHQRLQQVRAYGDNFYNAVMANAQTKIIFKVNDEDTAEAMSKHLFRKEFSLERPKHIMNKPITVGYRPIWLESESEGVMHITGTGSAIASATGAGAGIIQPYDDDGVATASYTETNTGNEVTTASTSTMDATAVTRSAGRQQAFETILEERPTELYKLDELIHEGMVKLISLPRRHAFIYGPEQKPVRFSTIGIRKGVTLDVEVKRLTRVINDRSLFTSKRDVVRLGMSVRKRDVLKLTSDADDMPEDFREPAPED